jgi:hypothetical protein
VGRHPVVDLPNVRKDAGLDDPQVAGHEHVVPAADRARDPDVALVAVVDVPREVRRPVVPGDGPVGGEVVLPEVRVQPKVAVQAHLSESPSSFITLVTSA